MRVLHVTASQQLRGAEVFAGDLMSALRDRGVEQRVAALWRGDPQVRFPATPTVLSSRSHGDAWLNPRLSSSLRQLLTAWEPDVIQLHGGDTLGCALPLLVSRHPAIVYRRIGCAPLSLRRHVKRTLFGAAMRRVDRVIAVAEAVQDELLGLFRFPAERVVMIPNGIDPARIKPTRDRLETRELLRIPADATVILSLGALAWEKDPSAHLRQAVHAIRRDPTVYHLFVGDGPMRPQVERSIVAAGIEERVLVLGARRDVADLLDASDVLMFASRRGGMEGMPASLIEAGMRGLAVAGFDVAGASEVVIDGATGYLVPWGDEESLRARLRTLIEQPKRRREMGRAARDRCRALFSIEPIADRYLSVYEDLVTGRHAATGVRVRPTA